MFKKKTAYIKEVTKVSVEWSISPSNHACQPQQCKKKKILKVNDHPTACWENAALILYSMAVLINIFLFLRSSVRPEICNNFAFLQKYAPNYTYRS